MKPMAQLNYHYGLKMRIYPSTKQSQIIEINTNIARTTYNKLLAIDREIYALKQIKIPVKVVLDRIEELKQRKQTPRYLANHYTYMQQPEVDSLTLANAKRNYQRAWDQYNKVHDAGTPKFHKKTNQGKYQTTAQYTKNANMDMFSGSVRFLDTKHIQVPKLGRLRVSGSQRRLLDHKQDIRIGTVTITRDPDNKYFVSFQLGSDTPFVKQSVHNGSQIGIDLNTENFLTTSTGQQIDNPRYYRTIQNKLRKKQRKLSRRIRRAKQEHRSLRESRNYQKQRLEVAKLHAKVRRQRHNFLNVQSTALINNHDLVVAEDLKSKNMLKNHALAMSISDVGWRTFLEMLKYKAEMHQKTVVLIDPKNTTQTCFDCKFVMGTNGTHKLTLKDREWTCPNCGKHHIRDLNASQNILANGLVELKKAKEKQKKKQRKSQSVGN